MTKPSNDLVTIHVNIDLTPSALSAIVSNVKEIFGKDANGRYKIDTADATSAMISRFLLEKDFESYAKEKSNYVCPEKE